MHTVGEFSLRKGEAMPFVLAYGESFKPVPLSIDAFIALDETERYWQRWSDICKVKGHWRTAIMRSLLTLKGLSYAPTGGIVAAVTTSLPEKIGSTRNWDYRYCWLRDATFTLLAFLNAGYTEEADVLAGMADAGDCRRARADPDHVHGAGRQAAGRDRAAASAGL